MNVSGGYSNYAYAAQVVNWNAPNWVKSIDLSGGSASSSHSGKKLGSIYYPEAGDDWDNVTSQNVVCITIDKETARPSGALDDLTLTFSVGDYADEAVTDGKADYYNYSYDAYKEYTFTIDADKIYGAQGVSFEMSSMNSKQRTPSGMPNAEPIVITSQQTKQGSSIYYQCWTTTGGMSEDTDGEFAPFGGGSWRYWVWLQTFEPYPSWVEWFDVQPPSALSAPFVPRENALGDYRAFYPFNIGTMSTENEICLRVAVKPNVTDTAPLTLNMQKTERGDYIGDDPDEGTPVYWEQSVLPHVVVTPIP